MTLDNDFVQLETLFFGKVRISLSKAELEWPPPEFLVFDTNNHLRKATKDDKRADIFQRYTMSKLTEEQANSPHLARGAVYRYVEPIDADIGHA